MARKNTPLNPAMYGLTQQDVERVIRMYLGWFGLASTTGTPLARMAAQIYQVCDEIRESLEEDTTINPTAEGSVEDAEREALFE